MSLKKEHLKKMEKMFISRKIFENEELKYQLKTWKFFAAVFVIGFVVMLGIQQATNNELSKAPKYDYWREYTYLANSECRSVTGDSEAYGSVTCRGYMDCELRCSVEIRPDAEKKECKNLVFNSTLNEFLKFIDKSDAITVDYSKIPKEAKLGDTMQIYQSC